VDVPTLLGKVVALEAEARRLLALHEASTARTVTLEDSYSKLGKLSLAQDELFREALRAVEAGLFRAAHVLAWAGFIDFLHSYLASDGLAAMQEARPKWNLTSVEDMRDWSDYAVIEAGAAAGFYGKTLMKALHGLLNRRNECAHPSDHFPDFNETLGYLAELFQRVGFLQEKASTI
jgi:hypothetical protein